VSSATFTVSTDGTVSRVLSVDEALGILRSATPTHHPFVDEPHGHVLGLAFVGMAHRVADFVATFQEFADGGYPGALALVDDVVRLFPVPAPDPLEEILRQMFGGRHGA
jgi:hypothetical protein